MPYNLNIPGQVSEDQLKAIELVALLVPANGHVVEVGSLFGRTGWAWAQSVAPSVTVHCLDPWQNNAGVRSMEARLGVTYGLEQFEAYLADCPNVEPHKGYSPRDFADWDLPVDLYYEDAVHTDPVLSQNLEFWSSRTSPHSIMCGDDFRPRFPDVRAGVQRLAERFRRELITVDFFWCLLPSEADLPGAQDVAARLRELSAESDSKKRARGLQISAVPLEALPSGRIPPGDTVARKLRICNDGLDPWPEGAEVEGMLRAGMWLIDERGEIAGAGTRELPERQLSPDLPVDIEVELDLSGIAPGSYRLRCAVTDATGQLRADTPKDGLPLEVG